jgi:putative endopeptidase
MSAAEPNAFDDIPAPPEPIRFDVSDLDPDGDPRVDLDAYVNARWRAANPVPPDRSCWDAFAILSERTLAIEAQIARECAAMDAPPGSAERIVGDFWASAQSAADGIEALEPELAAIRALDSDAAIAAWLRDRHARGLGLVFRLDVEPDFADPAHALAYVSPAGLGLPDRDDYFDATSHGIARRRAYLAYVQATLEIVGDHAAATLAEDVLALEARLAEATPPRRELARDVERRYRPTTIDAADTRTPHFRWSAFFREIGIEPPATFSLAEPAFFAAMDRALRDVPPPVWRAYLAHHAIDFAAPHLGGDLADAHHVFHGETLRGQRIAPPRWKRVLATIDAEAGDAMGRLYVERCFAPESKRALAALCETLREAFAQRIERLDWMSAPTRAAAVRKLAALRFDVGYPEQWRDFSPLRTTPRSLFANVVAARDFAQQDRVARIGRPIDPARWPMPPQTINARYDPQRNAVIFPAALLAPPFFDPDADAAINFGGIGAVIAHEMTHAFDDQGSRFGADGRFENWWTPEDRARFDALAERMIARFDTFAAGDDDVVDGRLTLGENIADFGGLAIAYDALQHHTAGIDDLHRDGYTRTQRFFFAWATLWRQSLTLSETYFRARHDAHAPAALRANAAAINLDEYTKALGCTSGDNPMLAKPCDRIVIW